MEEKKSFILYADLIHVIEKLDDENAGKLFKHILAYVNDLQPDPDNIVIELVFEPIKQQLKRDLKRWEKKKDKQSVAGTVGNLKRWHPDLFEDVENDKLTIEEAISIAKHRVPIQPNRTQSHPIGSVAVNDNVNVNVNVNDNVNVKDKKEIKGVPPSFELFIEHCRKKAKELNITLDESKATNKFNAWLENDWCDLNGKKILNWKVKITSNITYWQKPKQSNDNFELRVYS
jgi:hypothetical protein